MEVTLCISAVSKEELKREAGEFDLEAIAFLDLSDRGDSWRRRSAQLTSYRHAVPYLL